MKDDTQQKIDEIESTLFKLQTESPREELLKRTALDLMGLFRRHEHLLKTIIKQSDIRGQGLAGIIDMAIATRNPGREILDIIKFAESKITESCQLTQAEINTQNLIDEVLDKK